MVSNIGGGSNWDMMRLRNEELQRQQNTKQVDELQQQQAAQQLEELQRLQQEQNTAAPKDEDWSKIQQEYQDRQVQFQFDASLEYNWQLDENNRIIGEQTDFNISASMTKALYNDVINSVEELMKSMVQQDETLKTSETGKSHKELQFSFEWQQQVVNEALKANAQNISGLADEEQNKTINETARRPQVNHLEQVNQASREQNIRALRIDDPRQRFASILPQNRPVTEPRPVTQTNQTTVTNRQNNSLNTDLRNRMLLGQQRMAAASVGAPQNVTTTNNIVTRNITKTQETEATNIKMSLEQATKTATNFANYLAQSARFGISTDVNALVQYAIREAYVDGLQDLVFYRDKVSYNTECKKVLRNSLNTARQEYTRVRTSAAQALSKLITDYNAKSDEEKASATKPPETTAETENWLADYATKELEKGNFTAMTLDQSQNPPVMVKDSSTKIKSADDLDAHIEKMESQLATLGDDAQLANTDLQNIMQKQQTLLTMMSNISKLLKDTASALIRNLG